MNHDQRDIRGKLRLLEYAKKIGDVSKACRYFGVGRATFYRWRKASSEEGEAGLINGRSVLRDHPQKTSPEITEKILHLRQTTRSLQGKAPYEALREKL